VYCVRKCRQVRNVPSGQTYHTTCGTDLPVISRRSSLSIDPSRRRTVHRPNIFGSRSWWPIRVPFMSFIISRHILISVHGCFYISTGAPMLWGLEVQQCQQGFWPCWNGWEIFPPLVGYGRWVVYDTVSCTGDRQTMQLEVGAAEVGSWQDCSNLLLSRTEAHRSSESRMADAKDFPVLMKKTLGGWKCDLWLLGDAHAASPRESSSASIWLIIFGPALGQSHQPTL
jgi:hypothetical protein